MAVSSLAVLGRGHASDAVLAIVLATVTAWVAVSLKRLQSRAAELSLRSGQLEATLRTATRHLFEQKQRADHLASLSVTDELTGLHNRRGFMLLAEQHLRLASRSKTRFAILFADVNGLKTINDSFGHDAGDRAIRSSARILRRTLRECDIVARLGGDEFVALVSIPSAPAVNAVARRVQGAIDEENAMGGKPYELSLSLGTAMFDPESQRTLQELISEADELMYARKLGSRLMRPAPLRVVRSA